MQERLQAQSWPRLQMVLIVVFTGLAGLLLSAMLLRAGVHSMAWRYPLTTVLAYGAFLGLLWLWMRTRPDDWGDVADGVDVGLDAVDVASSALRVHGDTGNQGRGGGGDWRLGEAADADELVVVVLVVLAVVALASVGAYIVVQAPTLLAELALDGAVAGSLFHRLRQAERQHWARSAWQYTRWPLVVLVVVMALVGAGLQNAAPGAQTVGQALSTLGQ